MIFRFILGAVGALLLHQQSLADEVVYNNHRFGISITFPAQLFDRRMPLPQNGDGVTWLGDHDASLSVYGFNNALEHTLDSFFTSVTNPESRRQSAETVTYKSKGKNWVVVSGTFNHEDTGRSMIFYERYEFGSDGQINAAILKYATKDKQKYEPYLSGIMNSLSGPGR